MKINCELDDESADNLARIIHHKIIHHRLDKKCEMLTGDITESEYEWHEKHADYLEEEIYNKLFPKKESY